MSTTDEGSSTRLTSPLYSRPPSKGHSMQTDQCILPHEKPTKNTASFNVLFLGETNIGGCSVTDLVAGPGEQKRTSFRLGRRAPAKDVRSVTLDGNAFKLHAVPMSESPSPDALKGGIQSTLTNLRRNGGIHLLVYCINPSHSTSWVHEIHPTVASYSTHIPMVAVVGGVSDATQQESWWSSNDDALAKEGPRFNAHAFIRMSAQSPTGDHILESRHDLQTLILQNYAPDSESHPDLQPFTPQSRTNSFHSRLAALANRNSNSPHTSTTSKPIDIVLLGETGVGKSSLINLLVKKNVAEVSPDTIACTSATAKYEFEEKGRTFHLYDTPGLVDPQAGVDEFIYPIVTIQELIRNVNNGNGPDLLLFCVDNSKPTTALRRNYHLFCKIICEDRVPFALAITKLEEGQDGDQWWRQYSGTIRKYGVHCSGHIGFRREKGRTDGNSDLEEQSRDSLLWFLTKRTDGWRNGIKLAGSTIRRKVGSVTASLHARGSPLERTLMDQCELEEQTARELANRLISLK